VLPTRLIAEAFTATIFQMHLNSEGLIVKGRKRAQGYLQKESASQIPLAFRHLE
jgi:hypothetical protein